MDEAELKRIFQQKKVKFNKKTGNRIPGFEQITFTEFHEWFINKSQFEKGCYYCGTTNEESIELSQKRPEATRGGRRGKRLELDRKNPKESYDDLENVVWCCYWCNNAKSNFFISEEEFKPIGMAIGEALKKVRGL
jgi:hypothetical protein